jgi:hypothetical protein
MLMHIRIEEPDRCNFSVAWDGQMNRTAGEARRFADALDRRLILLRVALLGMRDRMCEAFDGTKLASFG